MFFLTAFLSCFNVIRQLVVTGTAIKKLKTLKSSNIMHVVTCSGPRVLKGRWRLLTFSQINFRVILSTCYNNNNNNNKYEIVRFDVLQTNVGTSIHCNMLYGVHLHVFHRNNITINTVFNPPQLCIYSSAHKPRILKNTYFDYFSRL